MPVFVNKFENYKEKKGTVNKMENEDDKANQSHAEKTDIKLAIRKYGMIPPEMIEPNEKLYLANIDENLTLNERMKRQEYMTEYFYKMPAKLRKEYHDNAQEFITDVIMNKNLEKCKQHGIITQEVYDNYMEIVNTRKLAEETKQKDYEFAKQRIIELEKQIQDFNNEGGKTNENNNIQ